MAVSIKSQRRLERIVAIAYEVAGEVGIDPRFDELWRSMDEIKLQFPDVVIHGLQALTTCDIDQLRAPQITTANWRIHLMAALRSKPRLSASDRQFITYAVGMISLGVEDLDRVRTVIERARRAGLPAQESLLLDLIDDDVGF